MERKDDDEVLKKVKETERRLSEEKDAPKPPQPERYRSFKRSGREL